jgi:hypothetical protein
MFTLTECTRLPSSLTPFSAPTTTHEVGDSVHDMQSDCWVHSRRDTKFFEGGKHGALGESRDAFLIVDGGRDGITLLSDGGEGFKARVSRTTKAPTKDNKDTNTTTGRMRRISASFMLRLFERCENSFIDPKKRFKTTSFYV